MRLSFWVGLTILIVISLLAILAPWLGLVDPNVQSLINEYAGPAKGHPLGFGENGVDLLSQVIWGARISLSVGFITVFIASFVGLLLGSISGFFRGWIDIVFMRIIDVMYAFPGILLVVALAAFLGPSIKNLIIVMSVTSWAGYARLIRGVTMELREREYIVAAKAIGLSDFKIIFKYIWPNAMAPLLVQVTYGISAAILTESSLSFLGLGAPPGTPSWGQLLNQGREVITTQINGVLAPGVALVLTVLSLNIIGDALRDKYDPKLRIK